MQGHVVDPAKLILSQRWIILQHTFFIKLYFCYFLLKYLPKNSNLFTLAYVFALSHLLTPIPGHRQIESGCGTEQKHKGDASFGEKSFA